MIVGADKITSDARYDESGNLHLCIHNQIGGDIIGSQIRYKDGGQRFSNGIRMAEAAPLIVHPDARRMILICEGPTDAISLGGVPALREAMIVGCWSSTIVPDNHWWQTKIPRVSAVPAYVLGDGDPAGKAFNQTIANRLGWAYPVAIPRGFDARQVVEENGEAAILKLISLATMSKILIREKRKVRNNHANRDYKPLESVDIVRLVEGAGAKKKLSLSDGGLKYLCPLHDDRHDPSLTVNPKTGSWKCWAGCGQGGPIQFVMASRSLSYQDALALIESGR